MIMENTDNLVHGLVNHQKEPPADGLQQLANTISKLATSYAERLTELGQEQPDMENPFPPIITDAKIQEDKLKILLSCERLMALVLGPMEWLMHQNMSFIDPACIGTALRMGLFDFIADNGEATSLDQLSVVTGASKDLLERILRVCTQRLVFTEVSPKMYKHNAVSRTLMMPPTAALVDFCCDDGFKAAAAMIGTLEQQKFQNADQPGESPFSKAMGTKRGMFDYYSEDDRAKGERFALAMAGTEMIKDLTEEIYPFEELPAGSTVVDVGGGIGTVSRRIMNKVPHLSFIVQDLASVIQVADDGSHDSKANIQFMPHDFFEEQPVKDAEVYLFRFILHDHPDRYDFFHPKPEKEAWPLFA